MSFYRKPQKQQQPRVNIKVRFLQAIAGHSMPEYNLVDFSFAPGSVQSLDSELADKWISSGLAEAVQ